MLPLLLCIGMDENQLMRIAFIASGLGIRVKAVTPAEWGQTIGALCGLDTPAVSPAKVRVQEAMLVMAFFNSALMAAGPAARFAAICPWRRRRQFSKTDAKRTKAGPLLLSETSRAGRNGSGLFSFFFIAHQGL